MSATIFTGWHLLTYGTATNIIFVGAAVLVLRSKVRESREYMAAGDAAFASAEQRDAAFEETRNKPWYWPTGPAIEAAPAEHEGEVLHVEHATAELRQLITQLEATDDDALPLSDRPAEDDDEVGDEPDRTGMWRVLLGLAKDTFDDMARGVADAINWPVKLARQVAAAWRRRRDERHLIGSGEQATDRDPFAELLAHVETPEPEPVRIVRVNRYRDPGMTGQFPYVKVAGAPRHAAPEPEMPAINASIPTQRTEGE